MQNLEGISIRLANWPEESDTLRRLRERVFIMEQGVPADIEWDKRDEDANHFLVFDGHGQAIATARLMPDGKLGRMAVLAEWRNAGVGSKLLQFILNRARASHAKIYLHAQVKAVSFYQRAGFGAQGEVFYEAGIPHQAMEIALNSG